MPETMTGRIRKLSKRGFGFIREEESRDDYFFHKDELIDSNFDDLEVAQQVEFFGKTETAGRNLGKFKAVDIAISNIGGNKNE